MSARSVSSRGTASVSADRERDDEHGDEQRPQVGAGPPPGRPHAPGSIRSRAIVARRTARAARGTTSAAQPSSSTRIVATWAGHGQLTAAAGTGGSPWAETASSGPTTQQAKAPSSPPSEHRHADEDGLLGEHGPEHRAPRRAQRRAGGPRRARAPRARSWSAARSRRARARGRRRPGARPPPAAPHAGDRRRSRAPRRCGRSPGRCPRPRAWRRHAVGIVPPTHHASVSVSRSPWLRAARDNVSTSASSAAARGCEGT